MKKVSLVFWSVCRYFVRVDSDPDKPYHLEFVDLVRFNSQGKIAKMKEFLDSGHIHKHVEEHESQKK